MALEQNKEPPDQKQPELRKCTPDVKEEQRKAEIRRKINYLVHGKYSDSKLSSRSSSSSTQTVASPFDRTRSMRSRSKPRAPKLNNSSCTKRKTPPHSTKSKQESTPKSIPCKRPRITNAASGSRSQRSSKRRRIQKPATKSTKHKAKSTSSLQSFRTCSSSRSKSSAERKRKPARAKTRAGKYRKTQRKERSTKRKAKSTASSESSRTSSCSRSRSPPERKRKPARAKSRGGEHRKTLRKGRSTKRKAKSTASSESSRTGSCSRSRSRSPVERKRKPARANTRRGGYKKSPRKGRSIKRKAKSTSSSRSSRTRSAARKRKPSREKTRRGEYEKSPRKGRSTKRKAKSTSSSGSCRTRSSSRSRSPAECKRKHRARRRPPDPSQRSPSSCKCRNKNKPPSRSKSGRKKHSKNRSGVKKHKKRRRWSVPVVDRKCLEVKRFVKFHYKFISYQEIVEYLQGLARSCPGRVSLKVTGKSGDGKEIYLVIISKNLPYPTMSTIIEAGSNGNEFFTVSSALCLIDYLARSAKALQLMDYYIIPCLNPDAYDYVFESLKNPCARKEDEQRDNINLSRSFPKVDIPLDKKSEITYPPEVFALGNTLYAYRPCSRMFISLRESGKFIMYPWGHTKVPVFNADSLVNVANAGAKMFGGDMNTYSISEKCHNYTGTATDYVMGYHPPISYCFSLHINDCPCMDEGRREERIVELGKRVRRCVKAMIRRLYLTVMENEKKKSETYCNVNKTVK